MAVNIHRTIISDEMAMKIRSDHEWIWKRIKLCMYALLLIDFYNLSWSISRQMLFFILIIISMTLSQNCTICFDEYNICTTNITKHSILCLCLKTRRNCDRDFQCYHGLEKKDVQELCKQYECKWCEYL